MILPNVRMSFGRNEARWLIRLLAGCDARRQRHWEGVLADQGIDALIDDPRAAEAVARYEGLLLAPPTLVLYVLIRRAFLERGLSSRMLADYTTALVHQFGQRDRSLRIADHDDKEYRYLVDVLADLAEAEGQRAFLLRAHLGNFALWLSGLFPDHIVSRVHRRGGPGLDYYEEMGRTGFRLAASDPFATGRSLDGLYENAAETFPAVRRALNHFSDQRLFPIPTSPVDRFLRQAADGFDPHDSA
ncbi:MAG: hypothetical protein JSV95_10870 [Gemmatimonadota bacterium]|nr:MAG: hypothetical protein JSV95_10870 [Gemmatimonadota bacterium]